MKLVDMRDLKSRPQGSRFKSERGYVRALVQLIIEFFKPRNRAVARAIRAGVGLALLFARARGGVYDLTSGRRLVGRAPAAAHFFFILQSAICLFIYFARSSKCICFL